MFIRNEEKKSMGDKRTEKYTFKSYMFVVFMCTKKYGHQ